MKLICMSFDGDYVTDMEGDIDECCDTSSEMGSKWYFYPFHFILSNSGKTVVDTGEGLVRVSDKKGMMGLLFKKRRLTTVIRVFKEMSEWCIKNNIEPDVYEYESLMFNRCREMVRE